MNIFEMSVLDLLGIGCLAVGISWLISLLLCWWKGDFDYLRPRIKKLYEYYYDGY